MASELKYSKGSSSPVVDNVETGANPENSEDVDDMAKFGKKQQLRRIFGLVSIVGLMATLVVTWETMLMVFQQGLENGGPSGLIYGYLFVWAGMTLQVLVMAELASMIPLAGGQYNWVAILSPPSCSKFLSYLTGWITAIGWQAALASGGYIAGTLTQGLITLNYPDYNAQRWHGTLLFYASLAVALIINTLLKPLLPKIEILFLLIHVFGFIALLVPLLVMAPQKADASAVFAAFNNGGGWSGKGLSFFVGLITTMYSFIGNDAASHLAEEIEHASHVIPRSMFICIGLNGTLGLAMLIAILFCLGDNLDAILNTPTGYPVFEVFTSVTGSVSGGTGMSAVVVATAFFAATCSLTTCSRMTWAFARERGLPFSSFLSHVHARSALPLNAILVTVLISALLALINIGSSVAFNAFVSLVVASQFSAFLVSASVLLHKRLTTPSAEMNALYGPFNLGRWGVPVILAAMVFSVIGVFFSFWPPSVDPAAEDMNWSIAVFGGALIWSLAYWALWGRKVYTGPIIEVNAEGQFVRSAMGHAMGESKVV